MLEKFWEPPIQYKKEVFLAFQELDAPWVSRCFNRSASKHGHLAGGFF
jgi:hypothetical protein